MTDRVKFASQSDPAILDEARRLAAKRGMQFQEVIEEALTGWIENADVAQVRPEVRAFAMASIVRNRELYRRLAQ